MTGKRTRHPSTALWTAIITLLLFSVPVHSQSGFSLNDAATSPHVAATESPSGSDVASLHKVDSIVDTTSTTLKSVVERPEGSRKAATFGEKIVVGNSTRSKLDDHQARDNPSKSGKLEVEDVAKVKGKLEPADSLAEFDEKEDLDTHELEEDNDRESTTPRTKKAVQNKNESPEDSKEKEIEANAGNSEALEFKEIEKTKPEIGISLVDDTNVNYKKKTVKPSRGDGILENDAKDLKSTLENATNVIASGDSADTQQEKGKGPKAQVEVVKDSSLSKSQRLTEVADVTGDDKKKVESLGSAKRENNTEDPTAAITGFKDLESEKYKDGVKETVLSDGEQKTDETEITRTLPSPKGRTISFGGINEFVTIENKTRENASNEQPAGVGFTKEIIQEHKNTEFKPYPYVKTTTGLPSNGSDAQLPLSGNSKVPESTEEASALENTIGQRQQDKKFVVTESSVDLDNSIQQFKPTYFKRSGNASRIQSNVDLTSSTISPGLDTDKTSGSMLTTQSTTESSTTANVGNLRVSNTENDVPLDKDEDKRTSVSIKETSSDLDLTGNGITEEVVGAKNHSVSLANDAGVTKPSMSLTTTLIRATEDTQVQNSTEIIATLSDDAGLTNMDIQTDAEDSMLKISPLNVTEGSTKIPSTESAASLGTTSPTTFTASATFSDSIEPEELVTTNVPDGSTDVQPQETLQPVESSTIDSSMESTTSKVEYEFIGLTESAVSQRYIASSESPNAVTEDNEAVSSTTSSYSEIATISTAATVSGMSSTPGDSSVDTDLTKETASDQESSTEAVTLITERLTSEDATTSISTLDFSGFEETTTTMIDNSEITTISDLLSTTEISETSETTTEEVSIVMNVTNPPDGFTDDRKNATDTGRAVDSSTTSIPDVSDKPRANSSDFSIESTESTNQPVTTESPEFIETTKTSIFDFTSNTPSSEETITPKLGTPSTSQDTSDIFTDSPIRNDIPALVRVVFEGNWADVCPHLLALRQSLADLLTSGLEKTVLANQIVFQKNPCTDGYSATSTSTELLVTSLLLYVVDQNGIFDGEMTKILPTLYSRSPIKLQVTIRSFQLVQDSDSGNAIAVVVVSCVAFICLVLLAGLLFIMRKRQTRFNYGERCRPVSLDAYSLDSVSAYNSVRRKGAARASKRSYGNPTFEDSSAIPSHPLNFGGLATFCNEQNIIAEEFSGIPQVTARIDELPPGAEVKNRYANVVPLPETRVSLMKINNDPLTEYINASYVRGPKNATKYYIACQAPIESTVTDFWRMIWEQQSKVIIMLTDLVENGVEKCAEYIPPSEVTDCHRLYGDFQVTLKKRETKEKYAISTLHLKNLENNTFREISHIWYLWPANGVQSDAAGLIAVLLEARALQRGGPGPIVVHCSPGTGRTGTLIALDLGIRQYEITRTIDVPRVVYTIRRDRAGAVQTKEQYAFIYKALNLYATKLAGGALES